MCQIQRARLLQFFLLLHPKCFERSVEVQVHWELINGARGAPLTYGQMGIVGRRCRSSWRDFSANTEPIREIVFALDAVWSVNDDYYCQKIMWSILVDICVFFCLVAKNLHMTQTKKNCRQCNPCRAPLSKETFILLFFQPSTAGTRRNCARLFWHAWQRISMRIRSCTMSIWPSEYHSTAR